MPNHGIKVYQQKLQAFKDLDSKRTFLASLSNVNFMESISDIPAHIVCKVLQISKTKLLQMRMDSGLKGVWPYTSIIQGTHKLLDRETVHLLRKSFFKMCHPVVKQYIIQMKSLQHTIERAKRTSHRKHQHEEQSNPATQIPTTHTLYYMHLDSEERAIRDTLFPDINPLETSADFEWMQQL
jgi:hypothetical protein